MNPIDQITTTYFPAIAIAPPVPGTDGGAGRATAADGFDTVSISRAGRASYLASPSAAPNFERIVTLREAIRAGTYETPERVNGTVDRLLSLFA